MTTLSLSIGTSVLWYLSHRLIKASKSACLSNEIFKAFLQVITEGGVWLAVLLRLVPVIPYSLCSVILGLTDLPFLSVLISAVGSVPGTVIFCWIGADNDDIHSILDGHRSRDRRDTVILCCTVVGLLIVTLYLVTHIRKHLTSLTKSKFVNKNSLQVRPLRYAAPSGEPLIQLSVISHIAQG
eukprot:Blabericola_migrator_1__6221@NODE_313_length_10046_cov_122_852390_g256_i0_p8_GENE_NODE_313_length_10046_cov_122_852390_g256_i0NODE_313_length_10046_cov_122_852390_g256_i0_p8_ORF_typecomplete_len183_score19_22SNARE_assoc/PF09335_11/4_1e13SNARE_assoc/PF09335_11/4e03DUF4727/PF15856_5/0_014DUF1129/PF06570_11/0_57DUF1129/PF06570_11/4_7e02_NODE_313_length_10046_cov_122_852390_g256_i08221370